LNFKDKIDIRKTNLIGLIFFSSIFSIIFCFFVEPQFHPDSQDYIAMAMSRSPGYPIFISLIKIVFSKLYLNVIVFFQFNLWIISSFVLIKKISKFCYINI